MEDYAADEESLEKLNSFFCDEENYAQKKIQEKNNKGLRKNRKLENN